MSLPPDVQKNVQEWLDGPYDEKTKGKIRDLLKGNPQELIDAFYRTLDFGTGGLRGIMGAGTNRMNIYTVRNATQGLANYILKQKIQNPSVAISFDSRHHSEEFAKETAAVLAGNGIRVFLTKELRPTPYLSFMTIHKKCSAGVMITASHNPAIYNGYKVYWSDGAQVVPPHDTGIIKEVDAITSPNQIKRSKNDDHLIVMVDSSLDTDYLAAIRPLQHFPEENKRSGQNVKITYTSLHGTGITMTPKALKDWGFPNINMVEKQITIDGDFPTVKFPNPEFKETLQLGLDQLQSTQSDILIANDPDADRVGVAVLHQSKPVILTGNEIASICVKFLCETLTKQNKMPSNGAFVTTIVTTELLKTIAESYQKTCFEVLTGFKYIGEMIHLWETTSNGYYFLFGAEESYGYLIGTHSRDKDAIVSSCLFAEMVLSAKNEGKTLVDKLYEIYQQYGIFREKQLSLSFKPGKEGSDQIIAIMQKLRKNLPKTFCGQKVLIVEDYLSGKKHDLSNGKEEKLELPKSDVLLFRLQDKSKLVIRPSGTEPKVKIYAAVFEKTFNSVEEGISQADKRLDLLLKTVKEELS